MKEKKKRHNEHNVLRFIGAVLICGLLGGMAGIFFMGQDHAILSAATGLQNWIADLSPYVIAGFEVFGLGYTVFLYRSAKQKFLRWDQEDEDFIEDVERQIEKGIMVTELVQIICFLLLAFLLWNLKENTRAAEALAGCVIFLVLMIAMVFVQRAYVELLRRINPEKRGDALDLHFQKKWIESCDELERMQIYESSYHSFQAMQKCFPLAMGILMFAEIYFNMGIFPIVVLGTLWLIQTVTYRTHAMKLSRRKGNKK